MNGSTQPTMGYRNLDREACSEIKKLNSHLINEGVKYSTDTEIGQKVKPESLVFLKLDCT